MTGGADAPQPSHLFCVFLHLQPGDHNREAPTGGPQPGDGIREAPTGGRQPGGPNGQVRHGTAEKLDRNYRAGQSRRGSPT